ncbi:DUF5709 domain-containing protein [Streptomyces sp. NPDC001549]|uniref:DUF5709 domain-containing protein n=1 Tax=Streptomyces sp. NPDC001549 TaxID=3364586 RepID=UPI0036A435E7
MPPDRPLAVGDSGTTAAEQRTGESLGERLAPEEPEVSARDDSPDEAGETPLAGPGRAGRPTPVEEPVPQRHISVPAHDVGIDGGAASAEEAAVHVVETTPPADSDPEATEGQ